MRLTVGYKKKRKLALDFLMKIHLDKSVSKNYISTTVFLDLKAKKIQEGRS